MNSQGNEPAKHLPLQKGGLRALAAFVSLAYALTWACWLPLAGFSEAPRQMPVSAETLATLGQFGPFLAAVGVAGVGGGWGGLRDLLGRLLRWRVRPLWFATALLLPPALALTAVGTQAVFAGRRWEVNWAAFGIDCVPHFVYILLVGGPLGEEPGWRGFALPRLQAVCPPLLATLLLALIWAGWHLPLWWIADVPSSFGLYVLGVVPLTFLFTWLSDHSAGSVPVAVLFHASINTSLVRLPLFRAFPAWTVVLWVAALAVLVLDRGSLRRPRPSPASAATAAGKVATTTPR